MPKPKTKIAHPKYWGTYLEWKLCIDFETH